jgi:hypothetical protein
VLLLSALWPDSEPNAKIEQLANQALSQINALANSKGLLQEFQYLNYAGPNQHPLQSYGRETLGFLEAVARKYDPHGVFQTRVPGGFKLR